MIKISLRFRILTINSDTESAAHGSVALSEGMTDPKTIYSKNSLTQIGISRS